MHVTLLGAGALGRVYGLRLILELGRDHAQSMPALERLMERLRGSAA